MSVWLELFRLELSLLKQNLLVLQCSEFLRLKTLTYLALRPFESEVSDSRIEPAPVIICQLPIDIEEADSLRWRKCVDGTLTGDVLLVVGDRDEDEPSFTIIEFPLILPLLFPLLLPFEVA